MVFLKRLFFSPLPGLVWNESFQFLIIATENLDILQKNKQICYWVRNICFFRISLKSAFRTTLQFEDTPCYDCYCYLHLSLITGSLHSSSFSHSTTVWSYNDAKWGGLWLFLIVVAITASTWSCGCDLDTWQSASNYNSCSILWSHDHPFDLLQKLHHMLEKNSQLLLEKAVQ